MSSDNYGSPFDDLLAQKLRTLNDFIQELNESILERQELSTQLREWIAEQYDATKEKLLHLDAWHFPNNPVIEQRRNTIERTLDTLVAQERDEQVSCWRDTELLSKELRQWQKQHEDLVQRVALLQANLG